MLRRRPGALALAALALAAGPAAGAETPPGGPPHGPGPRPIVLATDEGPALIVEAFNLVFHEAFRRLGVPLEIRYYSLERRAALADTGAIDGEVTRIRAYGDAHPELVRVEEQVFEFSFALFTARTDLSLRSLEELRGSTLRVEYRRGILLCERSLRGLVAEERLSSVPTTEQGVQKLQAGRADLFCDLDRFYVQEAMRTPELAAGRPVRRVLRFATLPTYTYLHRRHAALAARLAAVFREMKADGSFVTILRQGGLDLDADP